MIFAILAERVELVEVKFGTIFGVNVGFEIFTRQDYEMAGIPASWGFMLNLFCVRISVIQYLDLDE